MAQINMFIDNLTPCLIEASSGKIISTVFSLATEDDILSLSSNGWLFDWNAIELKRTNIYKLLIKNDNAIQGLIAAEVVRGAVFVHLTESAPYNRGECKKYEGVGGHLFAIAMRLSMAMGFGGYIYFDVKNMELVAHYTKMLGANRICSPVHEYRMEVQEERAKKIMEKYTMEGDLNVV